MCWTVGLVETVLHRKTQKGCALVAHSFEKQA